MTSQCPESVSESASLVVSESSGSSAFGVLARPKNRLWKRGRPGVAAAGGVAGAGDGTAGAAGVTGVVGVAGVTWVAGDTGLGGTAAAGELGVGGWEVRDGVTGTAASDDSEDVDSELCERDGRRSGMRSGGRRGRSLGAAGVTGSDWAGAGAGSGAGAGAGAGRRVLGVSNGSLIQSVMPRLVSGAGRLGRELRRRDSSVSLPDSSRTARGRAGAGDGAVVWDVRLSAGARVGAAAGDSAAAAAAADAPCWQRASASWFIFLIFEISSSSLFCRRQGAGAGAAAGTGFGAGASFFGSSFFFFGRSASTTFCITLGTSRMRAIPLIGPLVASSVSSTFSRSFFFSLGVSACAACGSGR